MTKVNLDLPPEVFSARRLSPDDFVRDMRLAAAIFWYQKKRNLPRKSRTNSRLKPP